jgi:hypothetical protein
MLAPGLVPLGESLKSKLGNDRFRELAQNLAQLTVRDASVVARNQIRELLTQHDQSKSPVLTRGA